MGNSSVKSTFNNIVRERTGCSVETLFELSKALDMPACQMLVSGIAESAVTPKKLDRLFSAYLNGDEKLRATFDRLTKGSKD